MSLNKDTQKAPNLRFKGFTDDWEQRKFKDFIYKAGKKNINNEDFLAYSVSNKLGLVRQSEQFDGSRLDNLDKKNYKLVNPGEFVYNPARINVGSIAYNNLSEVVIVSSLYVVLKMDESLNSDYILQYINSKSFIKEVRKNTEGSVREYLFFDSFKNIKFPLVKSIEEQQKIGQFFKTLDNTITLHQRKLDQLKQLKEALLQQMFPGKGETVPKLRFAGFEGDWEERKLGDLLHERNQKSVQTEEYPLVSFTVENGVTEKTERYNRNQLVSGDSDAKVYKVTKLNDIVYNPANLKFGAIDRNKYGKAVFSPIYVTFEVIEDYIFAEFIEFIVTSQTFIGRALKYQQGTVYERQSVGVDDFLNLTIRIPNLDEQKLIGLFLNDLNKKLLLQKDKLDQLKNTKQVLLQNMFI